MLRTNARSALARGVFTAMAVSCALSVVAPARAGDTTEGGLAHKLAKGDKFRAACAWDVDRKQSVMGMIQNDNSKVRVGICHEVTEVADGVASMKGTIESIEFQMKLPLMGMGDIDLAYDSTKAEGQKDKGLKPLGRLVGKTFTYKLAKDGAVTEITGVDEMAMEIITYAQARAGKGGGNQMADPIGMIKKNGAVFAMMFFNNDTMRSTLDYQLHVLPGAGAKAGEAWEVEKTLTTPTGSLASKVRYEEKGAGELHGEKGTKLEGAAGELKLKKERAGGLGGMMGGGGMGGMSKLKLKSSSLSQTSIFAKDQGRLLAGEIVAKADIDATMPNMFGGGGGGGAPGGDEDDDDGAPKKKKKDDKKGEDGEKKDEKKPGKKKGGEDEDEDAPAPAGGMKIGISMTLKIRWETLKGEPPAAPKIEDDADEKGGKKGGGDDEDEDEPAPKKPSKKEPPKNEEKPEKKKEDEKDKPLF